MIKILFIMLVMMMTACTSRTASEQSDAGDTNQVEKGTTEASTTETKESEKDDEHEEGELELNNGKKWKLDESTRSNVAVLNQILSTGEKNPEMLVSVRAQTDKLIRQCRLQGPEHEALHKWLKEFLEHLKKAEEGKGETKKLVQDMTELNRYFE
jgi:hypothetical protein